MKKTLALTILVFVVVAAMFSGCHSTGTGTAPTSENCTAEEPLYTTSPVMAGESAEAAQPKRLLTQVNYYHSLGGRNQYTFTYNENDLPIRNSADVYTSSDTWHHEYEMEYSDNGQLLQYKNVEYVHPEYEYFYSGDGVLTEWCCWEYDSLQVHYTREFDEQGRCIREASGSSFTDYTYDEDGFLISAYDYTEWGDSKLSTTHEYIYDADGRLAQKNTTSDWGGYIYTETEAYHYEYEPFLLKETYCDDSHRSMHLSLLGDKLDSLCELNLGETASFETTDGYLTKITGEDYTYEFFYDGEIDSSFYDSLPELPYEDELTGTYLSNDGNVGITITADSDSEYYLTYTASGVTLENIPQAYFTRNTATQKGIMFDIDAYYPEYAGHVEFCWAEDGLYTYTYNALIDGLDGSSGDFFPLKETGVFIPFN